MSAVLHATAIYGVLLVLFRIAGRRTLGQLSTFDFVLLLIISEATQQALLGDDFSLTTAILVIASLIGLDILFSLIKSRFPSLARAVDGVPIIVVENGRLLRGRLDKSRMSEDDILESARQSQGLERIEQIKFAILERNGNISIIPQDK